MRKITTIFQTLHQSVRVGAGGPGGELWGREACLISARGFQVVLSFCWVSEFQWCAPDPTRCCVPIVDA